MQSCLCVFPRPLAKKKPLKVSEHHVHLFSPPLPFLYILSLVSIFFRPFRDSARFRRLFSDQIEYPSIREIARVRMRGDVNTWETGSRMLRRVRRVLTRRNTSTVREYR